jgi:hypothetical protein
MYILCVYAIMKLDGDAPYKSCSNRVFTDESISIILSGELDHIHEANAQKLERQILRTACKRKAVDMISERPSKIINSRNHCFQFPKTTLNIAKLR